MSPPCYDEAQRRNSSAVSPPRYDEVPKLNDEKPFFGPPDPRDGTISVKYKSQIDGYAEDDGLKSQMESMGLPTGFSFRLGGSDSSVKQKKGDKKTFYCNICLIELNSLDTMNSHVNGVRWIEIF